MLELEFSQFPVLVVDDEEDNLDAFRFAFRKSFRLSYAKGGAEALELLETLDPAVIVTDQRMPGITGIELLRRAVAVKPSVVGVLLTAYTDLPVLLEAINSGAVYRYVQKPWDSKELSIVLRQAIERFYTLDENRRLRERLTACAADLDRERAALLTATTSASAAPRPSETLDLPTQLDEIERRELASALERCGGNKAEVARLLGIQRTTLYYRLKRLGIEA